MADVTLRYAFPDPALFESVAIYIETTVEGPAPVVDLLPPDMASIRMSFSGNWCEGPRLSALEPQPRGPDLFGPTSRASWLTGEQGHGFAIGLNPLAWRQLVRGQADRLTDTSVPLSDMWQDGADALYNALAGASCFEERVANANDFLKSRIDPGVAADTSAIIAVLRSALADPDCSSVEELCARTGLSQPRLARFAKAFFGFGPKTLIRRERFRRMLHRADLLAYSNWRQFIDSQYTDQSHLIRDFKRFLGMSPSAYFALDRPFVAAAFAEFRRLVESDGLGSLEWANPLAKSGASD